MEFAKVDKLIQAKHNFGALNKVNCTCTNCKKSGKLL